MTRQPTLPKRYQLVSEILIRESVHGHAMDVRRAAWDVGAIDPHGRAVVSHRTRGHVIAEAVGPDNFTVGT